MRGCMYNVKIEVETRTKNLLGRLCARLLLYWLQESSLFYWTFYFPPPYSFRVQNSPMSFSEGYGRRNREEESWWRFLPDTCRDFYRDLHFPSGPWTLDPEVQNYRMVDVPNVTWQHSVTRRISVPLFMSVMYESPVWYTPVRTKRNVSVTETYLGVHLSVAKVFGERYAQQKTVVRVLPSLTSRKHTSNRDDSTTLSSRLLLSSLYNWIWVYKSKETLMRQITQRFVDQTRSNRNPNV